ncbi:hypothetical protein GCM10027053_52800 [Intrasporangium mesophilum]
MAMGVRAFERGQVQRATGPGNAKPRVTCASPAACSLGSVVGLVALPGVGSLLVVTSTRPDLLGDQPGAATDAAAVLAMRSLLDLVASQHFELVHDDLLIYGLGCVRGPVAC